MASGRKMALLVIDMQEAFRACAAPILDELNSTIQTCRRRNIPVIFTQHGHRNLDVDGGVLAEKWGREDLIVYGSDKWKLIKELDVEDDEVKINEKRRYDAFYGTILDDILKQLKVDTLVISGVMTNLCCETTARSAFVRDYRVLFLSDGTGTNSSKMQEATLLNIAFGFGDVYSCSEFRKLIN